jgi:hypothetical protein
MNPGIHGSDFCLTGMAEVKEYPRIKQLARSLLNQILNRLFGGKNLA